MKKTIFIFSLFILLGVQNMNGQLPATDLYSFDFIETDKIKLSKPTFLSSFNLNGYNNQPRFINPDKVLISSDHRERGNTDVLLLNLRQYEREIITSTDEYEYSPTPASSGQTFTVVSQSGSNQNLVEYPLMQSGAGRLLLPHLNDIGYFIWLNEAELLVYRVTEPHSLHRVNINNQKSREITENPGRCLRMTSEGKVLYVHKLTDDLWFLKQYDPLTEKINVISQIDTEDFEVLTSGTIIKAKGSKLYKMASSDSSWQLVSDLASFGCNDITRLAASRNKLIIVSNKQ